MAGLRRRLFSRVHCARSMSQAQAGPTAICRRVANDSTALEANRIAHFLLQRHAVRLATTSTRRGVDNKSLHVRTCGRSPDITADAFQTPEYYVQARSSTQADQACSSPRSKMKHTARGNDRGVPTSGLHVPGARGGDTTLEASRGPCEDKRRSFRQICPRGQPHYTTCVHGGCHWVVPSPYRSVIIFLFVFLPARRCFRRR